MKVTKKLLSVLLAVIMIMSSMSVCFGTVSFAADDTNAVNAFVAAMKCDAMKSFSTVYAESTKNSGASKEVTNTFTYTAPSYAHYEQVVNVVTKLDKAIKGLDEYKNGSTHNNGGNCQDGWGKGTATDKCTDLGWIERHLKLAIGDAELATLNNTYNFAKLCNAIFNMDDCEWRNADNDLDGDDTTSTSNVEARVHNVLVVTISDVSGKILSYDSVASIPDTLGNKFEYKLSMCRQNYQTGSWLSKKNHYHHALNTKNSDATNPAPSQTGTTSTATIKSNINTCLTNLSAYSKYFEADEISDFLTASTTVEALGADRDAIAAVKKALTDTTNGTALYNKFVKPTYDAEAAINLIDNAIGYLNAAAVVEQFNTYLNTDFSAYTTAQLYDLKNGLEATYETFKALDVATQQMIIDDYGLDISAVEAKITAVDHAWQVSQVRDYKVTVDQHIADYENWELEDVDEGRVTTAQLTTALGALNSDLAELGNYTYEYVLEACGRTYVTILEALRNKIQYLATASGYNDQFLAEFAYFDDYIEDITTADYEDLRTSLSNYDARYAELKTLIAKMETELGKENADILFDTYDVRMTTHVNNAYEALNTRTEVQINVAYDLYQAHKIVYGATVHYVSLESYNTLKDSIGLIDTASYNFLNNSGNFTVPAETVKKYNELQAMLVKYDEFVATKGFSTFQQLEIDDITREEDLENEIVREGDYKVDDDMVEDVINTLEAALANKDVQKVLGSLINKETGEPFSLGGLINNLLNEKVYTDSLINTIIQFVYPLVAKEFAKVWAGLPSSITIPDVDTGFMGIKADVEAGLSLSSVEDAIAAVGVFLAPSTLAQNLENAYGKNDGEYAQYTEVISVLKSATTKAVYNLNGDGDADDTFINPWEDANLFENVYDEETGEQVFNEDGTPKQVYKLNWGVDEATDKRSAFVNAACAALSGLEPLLFALLTNKTQANANDSDGAPRGHKIGTGSGSANVGISLSLSIDPITLVLKFGGNDGYDNALAPIFEALGLTNIPHGEDLTTTRKILENGLLDMIDQLIAKLEANPLEFILDALPNLCYALKADLIAPILGMLRTEISYYADAKYAVIGGLVSGAMPDAMKSEKPIIVDLGEMLNLVEMLKLNEKGHDSLNFAAIWDMIAGGVELLKGIDAPDAAYMAVLGELEWKNTNRSAFTFDYHPNNKAPHVKANRADVLIYLVRWALTSGLLGGIVEGPDEMITEIFTNLAENSDDAIAAIVELLNQVEYDTLENYTWFSGYIDNQKVGTLTGTPAYEIYMDPGNDWTREKAEYLYNNLDAILTAALSMAGVDFDLAGMINGLFTNETVTEIAKLLGNLGDINALIANAGKTETETETETPDASEPETVAEGEEGENGEEETETETVAPALDVEALLKGLLGLDFSSYKAYAELEEGAVVDFGVEDIDTFAAALVDLLTPLKPVLDFILAGEDINITFSDKDKITLIGYNGYDSAIAPLLEALGCDVKALTANDDALTLVVNALVGKLADIAANGAIKSVIDILPGVLYFLAGNNLATVVRNLLQPVYVILDTIRPIYNLDLNELVAGIEIGEEGSKTALGLDLDQLDLNAIFGLAETLLPIDLGTLFTDIKQLIYDVCKVVGTDYDSVSALEGQETWKRGAYSADFDQADMITVILSFVLEWATNADNAAKLDAALGTDGIIASLNTVFADVEITYGTPNWLYWFESAEEFEAYLENGEVLPNTLDALTYPNDWTEEKAQYLADNLAVLVDAVVRMIEIDGTKHESVSALLNGLVYGDMNITVAEANEETGEEAVVINYLFSDETINALIGILKGVLSNVDDVLLEAGYELLNVDLAGLKNYTCDKDIKTIGAFVEELGYVLDTYAKGLVDLLFFGDDIRIAKKSVADENGEYPDTIVINGGLGYEKGLALILEALGCDVPDVKDATAYNVLKALGDRVEAILAAPVNEVIDLLPNLIYFLNADGLGVAVDNLLKPVYAIVDKINALGVLEENIAIEDLIKFKKANGEEEALNLAALSLEYIIEVVEKLTELDLSVAETILVDLCIGKIEKAKYTYKMTAERKDTVTVLLTTVLNLMQDEAFATKLSEMLGMDVIAAIRTVFESVEIEYTAPEWNYALAANGTVDTMKYAIAYPNNWNKNVAKYVTEALPGIGDMAAGMIDGNYSTLSALLKDKVNVFNAETLNSLVSAITSLLEGIDDTLLDAAGVLLNVDVVGLKAYKAPEGIATVEEFAVELAEVLNTYAKGVVEWLLLGNDYIFFVQEDRNIETLPADLVVINGAHGYAEGLALILEALGCENLPKVYDEEGNIIEGLETEAVVTGVLKSLATRINDIFDNPVEEVINLLPNLLYFLNTNGLAAAIDNLTAALTALLEKLEAFGVNVDINELVDLPELMGIADKYKEGDNVISLDNITIASLLKAVSLMVEGLDLTLVEDVLVGFALGKIVEYDSVSSKVGTAKKMVYADEFDKYDMVTVLVTLVVVTLTKESNAEFVKGIVGDDIYALIMNLCQADTVTVQEFTWMFTSDKTGGNKVGESFTAIETSDLFEDYMYGPHYTEEMAQYIADNFGEFVDDILYLLDLEIAGVRADNLTDLINGLLNGSLYNSQNVKAIHSALSGIVDGILNLEVSGVAVGGHIAAVLKEAGIADLEAVATVKIPEFSGNDENARVMFVDALCSVLKPLNGLLKWLLAGEDIAFFVDSEEKDKEVVFNDALSLKGAHGYSDGIIPLLEVLGCENILPAKYVAITETDKDGKEVVTGYKYEGEYYEAIKNGDKDVIVKSILNPLLDRLEVIVADPSNEILAMLPNLFYFINSNGIDTVVKNAANAVFMLLAKIEPIAKIDLYEIIGIDLAKINMNWIFNTLIETIENATGYKFETFEVTDVIAELTIGTLTEYTSLNGRTAYKMEYTPEGSISGGPAELVTVILRLLVKFIMHADNQEMLVGLLKDYLGMGADAEKYLRGLLRVIAECAVDTNVGMDMALSTIYYIYYGADEAIGGLAGGLKDINALWKEAIAELREKNPLLADMLEEVLGWEEFEDVLDAEEGLAPNGLIAFFLKIKAWFQKIVDWFKNLFNKNEAVATVALN